MIRKHRAGKVVGQFEKLAAILDARLEKQKTWNCNPGEAAMRLGLFLATVIGLAGVSHISNAADASWPAVGALENGMSTSCGGGTVSTGPEWTASARGQVDIKGNTLTFNSTSAIPNHSFTVDLRALNPDGSGKVVGIDKNNREFYLTFDPGSGARTFHMTYRLKACRRVYTPTT